MIHFENIAAFRAFVRDELPGRIETGKQAGLRAAGEAICEEMRSEIGTYQSGDPGFADWAPLAPGTLEGWDTASGKRLRGKVERGLASPGNDNPLKAEGALEASLGFSVESDVAVVGSADPVAVYQNQGTASRGVPFQPGETTEPGAPAREFMGRAAFRQAPQAVEAIGTAIVKAMVEP